MKNIEISLRYAKAVLAYAKESTEGNSLINEISQVGIALEKNHNIKKFFSDPMISNTDKEKSILLMSEQMKFSAVTKSLLSILAKNERLFLVDEIGAELQKLLDLEAGITRGTVRSAKPISSETLKDLEKSLSKTLNKKVTLTHQLDPKLIGGLLAQVGGWTFDDSLEAHLNKMSEELNRRV